MNKITELIDHFIQQLGDKDEHTIVLGPIHWVLRQGQENTLLVEEWFSPGRDIPDVALVINTANKSVLSFKASSWAYGSITTADDGMIYLRGLYSELNGKGVL